MFLAAALFFIVASLTECDLNGGREEKMRHRDQELN